MRLGELAMCQLGRVERCAAEIGAGKICVAQIRPVEFRALQLAAGKIDPDRNGVARRQTGKLSAGKILFQWTQVFAVEICSCSLFAVTRDPKLMILNLSLRAPPLWRPNLA